MSTGLESYIELDVIKMFNEQSKLGSFSVYASNALIQATYVKWENPSIANDPSKSIEDKRVENAPEYIHRFGATYTLNGFSITGQMSSVGEVFTDATNTTIANATATNGLLEAYNVIDVALHFKFMEHYNSFSVATKARKAIELQNAYRVEGVPALGIAGRFYTDGTQAKSMERALQVVDYLVAEVRAGR